MRRTAVRLLAAALLPLLMAASCEATRDLEGVRAEEPDSARVILNADQYPNLSILCVGTTAIVTTTREAAPAVVDRSDLCAAQADPGTQ